jgi:lipopolysaccharide/colanic/teichoic acid biosynthesis glycosyltransferase
MQLTVEFLESRIDSTHAARYQLAKRVLDFIAAALLLIILSLPLVLCALLVMIDSRGPVLFRQERVGKRGKRFKMLKFRTMQANVDGSAHRDYAAAFISGIAMKRPVEGRALYKLTNDPRITRVGRWLRRTSADELPQLWNVLRGDMSLVGPRPPLVYETEHYQPNHLVRLSVKPGITGLWQVSGRSATTFEEMVDLDTRYIRHQSLALDLRILAKTIPAVLFMKDAS